MTTFKYFHPPFRLIEPETETAANIVDSKGNLVAMMYWPTHPVEETEAAEQETYVVGRLLASAADVPKVRGWMGARSQFDPGD